MYSKSTLCLVISFLLTVASLAQNGKKLKKQEHKTWQKIGEKTVDFIRDRDEIKLKGMDHFEFIKIVATDSPIYLNNMVITFETGNDQVVNIKHAIKIPGECKMVKVFEPEREIRKIYFVYSTAPNARDKKAHLEVYGSKLKPQPKVPMMTVEKETNSGPALVLSDRTGWQNIGSRVLDLKVGRDEVTVLGADRFAIVKFRITNGAVNMIDAEFQFESGDSQYILLNKEMVAGMESAPLNLNGGERSLKKIIFNYKSGIGNYENEAEVEIWGYKSNSEQSSR
jgi:hypothetical protein